MCLCSPWSSELPRAAPLLPLPLPSLSIAGEQDYRGLQGEPISQRASGYPAVRLNKRRTSKCLAASNIGGSDPAFAVLLKMITTAAQTINPDQVALGLNGKLPVMTSNISGHWGDETRCKVWFRAIMTVKPQIAEPLTDKVKYVHSSLVILHVKGNKYNLVGFSHNKWRTGRIAAWRGEQRSDVRPERGLL